MLNYLKRKPLVGLALAIACGYVLAHIATRSADYFYENELDSKPASAVILLVIVGLILLLIYRYGKRSFSFIKSHWRSVAAFVVVATVVYVAMAIKAARREAILNVAHRAYADEYNRRLNQFLETHVGATSGEFTSYETNPKGQYGYAEALQRKKDAGTLRNWKQYPPTIRELFKSAPLEDPDAELRRQEDEKEITQLAKETGVDIETVRLNFGAIRKLAQKELAERNQATWNPFLARQQSDPYFAAIPYEDEYVKRLGDITNPSPELEKTLYEEIVVERQKHPIKLDFSNAIPITPLSRN